MHETFEDKVNAAMNAAREQAGKTALQSLRYTNNIVQMSLAGSKGSNLNISQMIACCAQQNVEGKRIPFGFTSRTLPHFNKDNYGPEGRYKHNTMQQGSLPSCIAHRSGSSLALVHACCAYDTCSSSTKT